MTGSGGDACVVGWDIGTTGVRAVVFDPAGRQGEVASREYPLRSPHPGWAEQDPDEVYEAAMAALAEAAELVARTGRRVAAVGVSAILHSLVPQGPEGEALGPSIIWADNRSVAEAEAIRRETDALALYRRTGCPVHPMYLPPKLRWLRAHQPEAFGRLATVGGIKEYVLRRWTGLSVTDRSIASGTGLYDLAAGTWDGEALSLARIGAGQLPAIVEPEAPLPVPAERLRQAGLPPDCVVVPGGGDGLLQTVGTGCVAPGQMVAMVATSGAIRAVVDSPRTDEHARTWCYYLAAGRWVAGAAINNAGLVYAWLRDQLSGAAGKEIDLEELNRWAEAVPPGSDGLLFLPYLAGERSPNWNANARGVLFGLSLAHDYRHLARATLEGVAYRMRTIFEPMEEVAGRAGEIRAAGGFVNSPLWLQIVADVLGRPLTLVESPEASALGAAQLALLGAGLVERFDDLAPLAAGTGEVVIPEAGRRVRYDRLYAAYQRIYERVRPEFEEIARLQAELREERAPPPAPAPPGGH
jgi:gluconokinase